MSQLAFSILKVVPKNYRGIGLLLIISIVIALWGTDNNVTADMLFQSPASPPPAPVDESAPPPEPAPPAEQPAATEPPADDAAPEQSPTEPAPNGQPQGEQPPPAEPAPELDEPPPAERRNFPPREDPEPTADRNFILDQAELIDSVVVSGAYIWLCCGVGLFLLIPLFLLVVYIRGRSKIQKQDDMFS